MCHMTRTTIGTIPSGALADAPARREHCFSIKARLVVALVGMSDRAQT